MNTPTIFSNSTENENFIKDFLNCTLLEIMSVIHADCGSLFLLDQKQQELVLNSFYNSENLQIAGLRHRIGEGIAGKVADIGTPILVKDIDSDARFNRNGYSHYRTKSFISLPIVISDVLAGVINFADKSSREPFSDQDLKSAITISRYAALFLDSLGRYHGLKREKDTVESQNALLEKYASVGKLAAGVVHEINNPLDGIIRYANILLRQLDSESITHEYLLEMKKGLDRIANITKSLLIFSHQVNSPASQIKKYVDPHQAINESLDALKNRHTGAIQIEKKFAQNMLRLLDFGLSHVILNISKNALDAMPEGGKLEISTELNDDIFKISFKDTGLGIPKDILAHIFEPFFTTKSIDKGTGLGLAICNEIINKYGGKIEVQSVVGKGTEFAILIPAKYLENV